MECSTIRSVCAPAGRGPKFGECSGRAKRYQPSRQRTVLIEAPLGGGAVLLSSLVGAIALAVVAARRRDAQARDAIADLPQAQAQPSRGGGAVEAAFLQRAN